MVTINNDDSTQNKNALITNKIQLSIADYNDNRIQREYLEETLISYAKLSGFITNTNRKKAWSFLTDILRYDSSTGYIFSLLLILFTLVVIRRYKSISITSVL